MSGGENGANSLPEKEKRVSVKSDVSKVLFPDKGKIMHQCTTDRGYYLLESLSY